MAVYERRYVLCAVEAAEALRALGSRLVREVFDRERPLSFTRTVYLDTGDLEYLRSSYRPVARRLRVRQYASARGLFDIPLFTSPVYLELKESCGATRLKRRISMAPRLLPGILDGTVPLFDLVGAEAQPPLARVVSQLRRRLLRPTLTTWYRRSSFVSREGSVRLTVDRQLVFAAGQGVGEVGECGPPAAVLAHGPSRVLEVKCVGLPPAWLTSALSGLREAAWFTKYRAGMEVVHQTRLAA